MTEERILKQHRRELQERGMGAYQLFAGIEGAGLAPEALYAVRKAAAPLAEAMISQAVAKDAAVPRSVEALVRLPNAEAILSSWAGAVEAALPWRPAVQLVLTHFGSWFERLPGPHARDAWLATLPRLRACFTSRTPLPWWGRIPFISRRGAIRQVQSDIEEILEAAASLSAADDCRRLLELLGSYGETTGDIVLGACRIGRAALRWKAPDLLDKLASIVDPKAWARMSEGDRNLSSDLFRSWGELGAACEASGEESWRLAIQMVPPLAEENPSSAQWAAQELLRVLQRLPREMTVPYLRCFRQLASAIGTRALGFALRRLPRLLAEHGVAPATSFVNVAAEVGQAYGPTAGQWFLERKTGAAKGML